MPRVTLLVLVMAAIAGACGGALTAPDAGNGQLGGMGGTGGGGAAGIQGVAGAGGLIIDARPPDEPCSLQAHAMAVADETCRFYLPTPPCDYATNANIGVRVGSVEIPPDPGAQDGWSYTDATQSMIQLYGPSCDAATATGGNDVTILYRIILP